MPRPGSALSPATDAVFTTWPPSPCSRMRGTKLRIPCATPSRFTPTSQLQSPAALSASGPCVSTPALLQTTSMRPKRASTRSAAASREAGSETSASMPSASAPFAASASPACARARPSTSSSASFIPAPGNAGAIPRPIPLAPPVITATRPSSFSMLASAGGYRTRPAGSAWRCDDEGPPMLGGPEDGISPPGRTGDGSLPLARRRNEGGMTTVIFACVRNAGRSQMAAAFFNQMTNAALARAVSAGTQPAEHVHTEVVEVMREVGIDLSNAKPRLLTDELAKGASWLISMGCGDRCPVLPGVRRDDWPLPDPAGQPVERVRQIRDEIRDRVRKLVAREAWWRPAAAEEGP